MKGDKERLIYTHSRRYIFLLLGLLQLVDFSVDGVRASLASNVGLEAVEVSHAGAGSTGGGVLGGGGTSDFGDQVEVLGGLLDLGGARTTLNGYDEISKVQTLKVNNLALHSMEGSVHNHAVTIDNLDDDGDLALLFSLVERDHAADLNITSEDGSSSVSLRLFITTSIQAIKWSVSFYDSFSTFFLIILPPSRTILLNFIIFTFH